MRAHQLVVPSSLAALLGVTLLLSLTLEHPFTGSSSSLSSVHLTSGRARRALRRAPPH